MDGNYKLDTVGSSYDTVLYVLDIGGCFEIACNDDYDDLTSKLMFSLAAGEEVIIVVDGYGGDSGDFVLNIDVSIDQCPFADLGSTVPQMVSGTTVGMNADYTGLCAGSGPEVSYSFTAPATGNYLMTTEGSGFDTVLYVHDGSCSGPPMACNDDYNGLTSLLYLALQQNQTVIVFVDSFSSPGDYVLNLYGPL